MENHHYPGADPGFQVRGAHLKKLHRAEGGAKIVGVFRVKNHDFTQKNHIFSNFRGAPRAPASLDPPLLSEQFKFLETEAILMHDITFLTRYSHFDNK